MRDSFRRLAKLKIKELNREYCSRFRRADGNVIGYLEWWAANGKPKRVDDPAETLLYRVRFLTRALADNELLFSDYALGLIFDNKEAIENGEYTPNLQLP